MGDGGASAAPATAAECLAQCGSLGGGSSDGAAACLAQTVQRLLNSAPLEWSCRSSCVTGLLHSACGQCGGCAGLQLEGSLGAADRQCLVDAAP